jgi:hypothetical protein
MSKNALPITGKSSLTISANPVEVGAGVSAVDCEGRTIWIVDTHRGDGKRFIVRADEKLTFTCARRGRNLIRAKNSPLFEIAIVLGRFNHVASVIENADHSIM